MSRSEAGSPVGLPVLEKKGCLALLITPGSQRIPEGGDVHDGNALDLSETQEVMVGRHKACRMTFHGTVEKFIVVRIAAPADVNRRRHALPLPSKEQDQSAGLNDRELQLAENLRPLQNAFDFVQGGFREQQLKLSVKPCFENLYSEAFVAGNGAAQEYLRIKDDAHV